MSRFPHNILSSAHGSDGSMSQQSHTPPQPHSSRQHSPSNPPPPPTMTTQHHPQHHYQHRPSPPHDTLSDHPSTHSPRPYSHTHSQYGSSSAGSSSSHINADVRRASGGAAGPGGGFTSTATPPPPPTIVVPLGVVQQQQLPPHHQRTTLPPLSSFSTRPSSNSLSAIPTPTVTLDWDNSRPRAASASSSVANAPAARGTAVLSGPQYPHSYAPPHASMSSTGMRHPEYDNVPGPHPSYDHQPQHHPVQRLQEASSLPVPAPSSSSVPSNLPPPPPGTWATHHPPPPQSGRQGLPVAHEGRPRAGSGTGPGAFYGRGGSGPESGGHPGVMPSGATTAAAGGQPSVFRAYTAVGKPSAGSTTTHMAGTISASAAQTINKPSLEGFTKEQDGKRYRLVVVQSPSRARMCGFGDKDRRPLSPTLIVKLIITDTRTNQDVAPTDVDTSAFFLAADLVHPEDLKAAPRNLLVHQHAASVATDLLQQSGLTKPPSDPSLGPGAFDVDRVRTRSLSDPWLAAQAAQSWGGHGYHHGPPPHAYHAAQHPLDAHPAPYTTVTTETYTRNFVGASVASANILKDENDHLGIFFVLQDLSVRTEGVYRIKLMFVNLAGSEGQIKMGVSEALAETYTDPFTVYTPRRFPGVIEPTALSKKFAAQGVKIPVRVDRKKRRRDSGEDGDGGYGEEDGDSG